MFGYKIENHLFISLSLKMADYKNNNNNYKHYIYIKYLIFGFLCGTVLNNYKML
jgi:hypothetical protein